jgi:hypothetical protein
MVFGHYLRYCLIFQLLCSDLEDKAIEQVMSKVHGAAEKTLTFGHKFTIADIIQFNSSKYNVI